MFPRQCELERKLRTPIDELPLIAHLDALPSRIRYLVEAALFDGHSTPPEPPAAEEPIPVTTAMPVVIEPFPAAAAPEPAEPEPAPPADPPAPLETDVATPTTVVRRQTGNGKATKERRDWRQVDEAIIRHLVMEDPPRGWQVALARELGVDKSVVTRRKQLIHQDSQDSQARTRACVERLGLSDELTQALAEIRGEGGEA